MKILDGKEYIELGKLLMKVKRSWYEDNPLVTSISTKNITISLRVDNRKDSGIICFPSNKSSRNRLKSYHILRFDEQDVITANTVSFNDSEYIEHKTLLARIWRILRFCDNPCCIDAKKNFYRLYWNLPLNFCQFCGEATGIEKIKENSERRFENILAMH